MTNPYYVSPEQVMKDRADYARKGIARGRSLVAIEYDSGIVMVAENPSKSLHKISEIYDRIAFAGVGKYNEFQMLRDAGVRLADQKGYAYSREDVVANELANTYAQSLGQVFTHEMKPFEVEVLIAQIGSGKKPNEMFHVLYDGTVMDESRFCVLGGNANDIETQLEADYAENMSLDDAIKLGAKVLKPGDEDQLDPSTLEVGYLDRTKEHRCFIRMKRSEIEKIFAK